MTDVLDKAAVDALRKLIVKAREPSGPLPPAPGSAIPAQRGVARPGVGKQQSGGGGGIASPLKEVPGSRVYYAPVDVSTTDGAIIFRIEPLKEIKLQDADGVEITVQFENA